ncbi:SgcJ/EcaC family oxidoreductase [Nocardia sp. NPDC050406]|uniref:SgcJ/EcaC family oxidoreductase n=1 Tax=Nocardia sp. NPDC050406 TaxID=3364318 RepID=UPI0037B9911C
MTTQQLTDEAAVRAVFDRLNRAWADADADAFAAEFTDDADYVTWFGTYYRGRSDIATVHRPVFEKWQKGTRLDGEVVSVRFPTPDVALVHGLGAVVKPQRRRTARNTKVNLLVMVRQGADWRIAAFHNTKRNWLLAKLSGRHEPTPVA